MIRVVENDVNDSIQNQKPEQINQKISFKKSSDNISRIDCS